MESFIQLLIYVHAFLGGVGLLTGAVSLVTRKGGQRHTQSGKVFSGSMIGSALISLFVARMPGHENVFLFLIGIFTIYMVLAGNRALTLRYPQKERADTLDYVISGGMLLGSTVMIGIGGYGMTVGLPNSILFLFFGGFGSLLTLTDFLNFRRFRKDKMIWLKSHIGRLVGALIASVTAFMVAGLNFTSLAFWITPTILGTIYIRYWTRRVDKRGLQAKSS
ncbi:MAG: hypothetical protein WA952_06375 [Lewinella sp.]